MLLNLAEGLFQHHFHYQFTELFISQITKTFWMMDTMARQSLFVIGQRRIQSIHSLLNGLLNSRLSLCCLAVRQVIALWD